MLVLLSSCGGGNEEGSSSDATTPDTTTLETTATETETTTAAEPSEAPGEFLERTLGYETKGQYGRSWDVLHSGHQAAVTRDRYDDCRSQRFESGSVELVSFDVVEVYDDPVDVTGVPEKTSKAVTFKLTARSGDETESITDTAHALGLLFDVQVLPKLQLRGAR